MCRPTAPFYCYKYEINTQRCRRSKRCYLFVLVFGGSRSEEVMIVSIPFTFQVCPLQGLVKLETELARRAQVKQLKSEKRKAFSLLKREILRIQMLALVQRCLGHCQPARSHFLKRQRPATYYFRLLRAINDFLQN